MSIPDPDGATSTLDVHLDQRQGDWTADLRLLGRRIDGVRQATVNTVARLQPQLADVQAELGVLRGEVTRLCAGKGESTSVPVNWPALSAKDAAAAWEALGQWVQEVLGGWYEVTRDQLPDCWALHPPALMQVSWLWTSHLEAYQAHSRPYAAAEWNIRWLDAALEKIRNVIPVSHCRSLPGQPGEHLVDRLDMQRHDGNLRQPAPATLSSDAAWTPGVMPTAAPLPTAGMLGSLGQQVIHPSFWQPYFRRAMQADLAQRHQREATHAASE